MAINAVLTWNNKEFNIVLNNNGELSTTSGLPPEVFKEVTSQPLDPTSTKSCHYVPVQKLIKNGSPLEHTRVKLGLGAIQDATAKAAQKASHGSGTKIVEKAVDADVLEEWKQAMVHLDLALYPKLVAFMGVEDPTSSAVKALMALGYSEEQAKKLAVLQK